MADTTPNLGLRKPAESDYFDIVGDFNANWDKIDGLTHIVKSGSASSKFYEPGNDAKEAGTVTWRYKKFSDGTFEMFGMFTINNMICKTKAADGSYASANVKIKYPTIGGISDVLYRSQTVRDGTDNADGSIFNSIVDVSTRADSLTYSTVRLYSTIQETANRAKNIYIEVKGLWS